MCFFMTVQLITVMLVGTDVCVRVVFVWEETGVRRGNSIAHVTS